MMPAPNEPVPIRGRRGMEHLGVRAREDAAAWVAAGSLSPAARVVIRVIADHVNADGGDAWPSQDRIAAQAGYSDRTVRRAIAELSGIGAVVILRVNRGLIGRGGITNRYRIASPPTGPRFSPDLSTGGES